jgi:hypothetical protein
MPILFVCILIEILKQPSLSSANSIASLAAIRSAAY